MVRKLTGVLAVALIAGVGVSTARAQERAEKTIAEIAAGNKNFTKLVTALKAAGLVDTLQGDGPFTVFAPTDKAFEALGEETLNKVLADRDTLKAILTYHVVKGNVPAQAALTLAKDNKSARTVNGAEIDLSVKDGRLYLNGQAQVVQADVMATNGVIHVIDQVILPPKK